ncbi:alpha/beta fold hydrolase [Novosphingobium sp.]|uniref:alpha/beta fold hydrolase n=1 Tax=Novosphingobium sp. TaxID=1874826 RepID=UPI0038B907B5
MIGRDTAPWLVLCHGMGLDRANMMPLAQQFARDWRVLVWDMPGHGASTPQRLDRMDRFAEACESVMAAAGVSDPVLVGFSFGGVLAQYLIARGPHRYRALVAYGCYAPFHQAAVVAPWLIRVATALYRLKRWPRLRSDFAKTCAVTPAGRVEALRAVSGSSKPVFIAMVRALLTSFASRPGLRFVQPLLIVRGALDSNTPALQRAASALLASHPHAIERILPDAGHCAHDDRPEALAQAIGDFLSDVLRASPTSAG